MPPFCKQYSNTTIITHDEKIHDSLGLEVTLLSEDNVLIGSDLAWASYYDDVWMLGGQDGEAAFLLREAPFMPAHSAYLPGYVVGQDTPLAVQIDDTPGAIAAVAAFRPAASAARCNVAGQRVGRSYRGLVISQGKKMLQSGLASE